MGWDSAESQEYTSQFPSPEPPAERSENQYRADEFESYNASADEQRTDTGLSAGHSSENTERLADVRAELLQLGDFDPARAQPADTSADGVHELARKENFERMEDILARPGVAQSTDEMLRDSQLRDSDKQHIEGAFIVEDAKTGDIRLERVTPPGTSDQITWPEDGPALGESERLVGLYHTQPVSEVGNYGDRPVPTQTDRDEHKADYFDVPGVVANERGHWVY